MNVKEEYDFFVKNRCNLMYLDTSKLTNVILYSELFSKILPIKFHDFSNVTNIDYLFYNKKLSDSDLSFLDISSVTSAECTFCENSCEVLIDDWNTSKLRNTKSIFERAVFNSCLSDWDTSNIKNSSCMFYECKNNKLNVKNWNMSNCENMDEMFYNSECNNDIYYWDISKCKTLRYTFASCIVPSFSLYLDTSSVRNMHGTFRNSYSDEDLNMNFWDTSNCNNMVATFSGYMRAEGDKDDSIPSNNLMLEYWDISSVKNMNEMFCHNDYVKIYVSDWNTSEVKNIRNLLLNSSAEVSSLEDWYYVENHANFLWGSKYLKDGKFSESFAKNYKLN